NVPRTTTNVSTTGGSVGATWIGRRSFRRTNESSGEQPRLRAGAGVPGGDVHRRGREHDDPSVQDRYSYPCPDAGAGPVRDIVPAGRGAEGRVRVREDLHRPVPAVVRRIARAVVGRCGDRVAR